MPPNFIHSNSTSSCRPSFPEYDKRSFAPFLDVPWPNSMENTSHIVPQWQRALIVSDDSIFEDFGPLSGYPVPKNPIIAPAAIERDIQPMDQVKPRFPSLRKSLIGRTRRLLKPIVRGNNQHRRTEVSMSAMSHMEAKGTYKD